MRRLREPPPTPTLSPEYRGEGATVGWVYSPTVFSAKQMVGEYAHPTKETLGSRSHHYRLNVLNELVSSPYPSPAG
jgi:hypothetical protein